MRQDRACVPGPLEKFGTRPAAPGAGFFRPLATRAGAAWCAARAGSLIKRPARGLLQKTQTRKMPGFSVVARTSFWSFCAGAGQRRIGPGQITDGT